MKRIVPQYLFVYGTLRRKSKNEVSALLRKNATFMGLGTAQGRLYDLGEYPAAVPDQREQIVGELYSIGDGKNAEILAVLDEYEEYNASNPEQSLYIRKKTQVKLDGQEGLNAWIYWYNKPVDAQRLIPTGDYTLVKV